MIKTVREGEMIGIIGKRYRFRVVKYVDVDVFGFDFVETVGYKNTKFEIWGYIWSCLCYCLCF